MASTTWPPFTWLPVSNLLTISFWRVPVYIYRMEPAVLPDMPQLDKPGAGVPWAEGLMYRYYIGPFIAAKSDWEKNWQMFDKINAKTLMLAEKLTAEQLTTRILVPRLKGIEDSSRYWSVAMTLEHLVIVGTGITGIIKSLGRNITPPIKVNIAALKPKGHADPQVDLQAFRQFSETTRSMIETEIHLPISRTHKLDHPWFGAFDALQWQWLLGVHGAMHYRQIKAIISQLK